MKKIIGLLITVCLILAFSGCASTKDGPGKGSPDWVRDPYAKYDSKTDVAAIGLGNDRESAGKKALGELVSIFGQSIQVDQRVSESYREAMSSGAATTWTQNTSVDNTIATSSGLDTLVGAEIGDTWYDSKDTTYYAVAVLNKAKASRTYTDMVRSNQQMISNLTNLSTAEKNTIDGYVRYQLAANIADINISYGNLLSQVGSPMPGLKPGNDYRIEAAAITREIPIGIVIDGDRAGKIRDAFAGALSEIGFRSGGPNSRYVLNIKVTIAPAELPNNTNKFSRIEVSANLTDTAANTVLVPFNFNLREGHSSQSEADNRAYTQAENRIKRDYKNALNDYLSQLLPKN